MYGVAFSMVTAYLLRNICFSSLYVAKILNVKWYVFLVSLVPGILSMLAVSAISFILNYFLKPKDWSELIFCGGMVCVIYLLVAARLILTHEDREILLSLIPTRRNSFV